MVEAKTTWTKDELWADLAALGEDKVREQLVTGFYGEVGERHALVVEWLRVQDDARKQASQAEQAETARSAKDAAREAASAAKEASAAASRAAAAAERQATAAEHANKRATIALIVAAISATVAIISVIITIHAKYSSSVPPQPPQTRIDLNPAAQSPRPAAEFRLSDRLGEFWPPAGL